MNLLLDYSIKEAQAEAMQRNNVFRRFLGHNLPRITISPVTAELENIKVALVEDDQPDVSAAVDAANRLESLFEHYENLLIAFMPSERREAFSRVRLSCSTSMEMSCRVFRLLLH